MRRHLIEIKSERSPVSRALPPITGDENGRSEEKNVAVASRHASLRRRPESPDLCRGQGLGRTAPPPPCRPEDRDVPGPPGLHCEIGHVDEERRARPETRKTGVVTPVFFCLERDAVHLPAELARGQTPDLRP